MKKTFEDYYQEVISTLEEFLECTTSDAQGIAMPYEDRIREAYEQDTEPRHIAQDIEAWATPEEIPASHTPGPWKMDNTYNVGPEITAQGQRIAHLGERIAYGTIKKQAEAEANARLIAAAPELLEALKELYKQCSMVHKHWGEGSNQKEADAAIEAGKKAIAKATQAN